MLPSKRRAKSSIHVQDEWSSLSWDPIVEDQPKKPLLYTHDGKPLTRGPQRIGFAPNSDSTEDQW